MVSKLDLYKVFCKVGKSDSFSKAAKDLYHDTTSRESGDYAIRKGIRYTSF